MGRVWLGPGLWPMGRAWLGPGLKLRLDLGVPNAIYSVTERDRHRSPSSEDSADCLQCHF